MSWFWWLAFAYGLLMGRFLGVEIVRQRRGTSLPMRQLWAQRVRGTVLMVSPFIFGGVAGDRLTSHESLAVAVTPFVLLFLFFTHMAAEAAWTDRCERQARE